MPHDVTITMNIDTDGLTQSNLGAKITHSVTGDGRLSQPVPNDSTKDIITLPYGKTLNWRFREKNNRTLSVTQVGITWKPTNPVNTSPPILMIITDPEISTLKQLETQSNVGSYPNQIQVHFPYTFIFIIGGNSYTFDPKLIVTPSITHKP